MLFRIPPTEVGVVFVLLASTILLTVLLVGDGPLLPTGKPPDSMVNESTTDETDFRLVVIFRDDDLEPGHRDDLRRAVHRTFVAEDVPVTRSVIPTKDGEPITTNEAFCEELRQERRTHPELIEYAMHGYRHEERTNRFETGRAGGLVAQSEFGGLPYGEQRERIADGASILNQCLGDRPRTFVPPYGTYDDATVRALAAENVTTVSGGAWFTEAYYDETSVFETDGVLHVPRQESFVRDWESESFYDQQSLRAKFDRAHERGGLYLHVLHYWTFTSERRLRMLRSFIEYVKKSDVRFMTVGEFADSYRDGKLTRTEHGWAYDPSDDETTDGDRSRTTDGTG